MLRDVNVFRMFPEVLVAHADHCVALTSVHGTLEEDIQGLYLHQTRFLSSLALRLDGEPPIFVSANAVDPHSLIAYYLAPSPAGRLAGPTPDDPEDDGGALVARGIELQVNRFVGSGMHQDVILTNHTLAEAVVELAFRIEADFADIADVVQRTPQEPPPVERTFRLDDEGARLTLSCKHPRLDHQLEAHFPPGPVALSERDGWIVGSVLLKPRRPVTLCIDLVPVFLGKRLRPTYRCGAFRPHHTEVDEARDAWERDLARLHTPNATVQMAWDRAVADLGSLMMHGETGLTPAAGIPIYQALFGRDTLTASWQSGLLSPALLRNTLDSLAAWQGERVDDPYDEEPGKHLHQHQLGPRSLLGRDPYLHYWGDYAGPGMFLVAVAWHFALTHDRAYFQAMREPVERTLAWMDTYGDRDGDGFYEYATHAGRQGTKNQGWKDSPEAMLYPDGRRVENPIAPVEIQGYYYAAKQLIGLVLLACGELGEGRKLLAQAADLKQRFNRAFWLPEQGFYALALDAEKRPVATIASNAGHCLACGIVDHDKAAAVARRLMAPDMFGGWGIRTLASSHPAFNPFGYHLGTVWPSENGSIALGLRRYGFTRELHDLARGLFDATTIFNLNRLPEAIGGHDRDMAHPHPGIYPQANAPQAWSASAVIMLVQALLGLIPLAPWRTLVLDPALPDWLPGLTLENLQVGPARVSLRFERDARGHTHYEVLAKEGPLHLLRQPPPDDLQAGFTDRLGALFASLLYGHHRRREG